MKITIRPLRHEDTADLFYVIDSQREYLGEWLAFVVNTRTEADTLSFVTADIASKTTRTYAITADGVPKGLAGIVDIDTVNKKGEIGYWQARELQGMGIMTGAVHRLLEICFAELGLNRVQIKAAIQNQKSRKIPERLGFRLEGIERAGELLSSGFIDLAIYSILKSEFYEALK